MPKKVRLIGVVHLGQPGEPFPPQPKKSAAEHTRWLLLAVHARGRTPSVDPSAQPTSKTMPWASGRSLEPLIVAVWRRM